MTYFGDGVTKVCHHTQLHLCVPLLFTSGNWDTQRTYVARVLFLLDWADLDEWPPSFLTSRIPAPSAPSVIGLSCAFKMFGSIRELQPSQQFHQKKKKKGASVSQEIPSGPRPPVAQFSADSLLWSLSWGRVWAVSV